MKTIASLLVGATLVAFTSPEKRPEPMPEKTFPNYVVNAFQPGEKIVYRVHYGAVTAGEVSFEIDPTIYPYGNRKTYRYVVNAASASSFESFYKYKTYFETYVDTEALFPWRYTRTTQEGDYHYDDNVTFNHYTNTIVGKKGTFQVNDNTQDIISVFYYARCLSFDKLTPGKIYKMPMTFLDDKTHAGAFKYYGKEVIKTPLGRITTHKVSPVLDDGSVFHGEEEMKIWITADANKIPVKITSPVIVGSITVDLKSYSGLKNPFTSLATN